MELKRGAISYSIDEHMEAVKKNKNLDLEHQPKSLVKSLIEKHCKMTETQST